MERLGDVMHWPIRDMEKLATYVEVGKHQIGIVLRAKSGYV